jgi:hypothetical protein
MPCGDRQSGILRQYGHDNAREERRETKWTTPTTSRIRSGLMRFS